MAWQTAAFVGVAYAGKLKGLEEYLPSSTKGVGTPGANQVLNALFKLRHKGVPMTIERIERVH